MSPRTVSLVLTSCNRFDLLLPTLESFVRFNSYPLAQTIIIEDSGDKKIYDIVAASGLKDPTIIINKPQLGQIKSIDKAYKAVTSEFIFHCEDDWLFLRSGFIEDSIKILDHHQKVIQVGLREPALKNDMAHRGSIQHHDGVAYKHIDPDIHPRWFGYSFNPGLRRRKEYQDCGSSFSDIGHENEISMFFKEKGYSMTTLNDPAVRHLGHRRTVRDPKHFRPITRIEKWMNSIRKRWHKLNGIK